ncbi:hypothetical protein SH1V18_00270 [Vallitalea longa]|uniref:Peptidase M56 domain-containing protein n=1 Tax=Vallitalea longa TaxID=2936439 RepID=A0A9W5Y716_9FIRM|nr:M56 family metallopeptidase [Vallitalea longa]GKX27547.1 hypothetical protein SH1V18_00270 [Vallitalea longa]
MSIINKIFENVLFTSFTSTLIALILLLIRYFFKSKINMRLNQVLLSVIILKFCLVIVPESSISIFNLLPQFNTENTISESLTIIPESIESQQNPRYSIEKHTHSDYNKELEENTYDANDNVGTRNVAISMKDILSVIWLSGFLIILIGACILQWRFNNRLKLCMEIDNNNVLNIVDKCKTTLGVKRDVKLYMENRFKSPFIIGFFTPRIYIPEQLIKIETEDLEHIIMHEVAHYKRKDSIYNILSIIAISINWFNPLIWKMSSIIRSDIELACDSYVLDKLGEDNAVSYGKSMLAVARIIITGNKQLGLACYFSNSKKQLERRITMISKFKENTYKFTAATLSAALLFGGVVFTNPVKAKQQDPQLKYVNEDGKDLIENILNTTGYKTYTSLDRLLEDVDFNIMIPEYIPQDDYRLCSYAFMPQENKVKLHYSNRNNGKGFWFVVNISPTDPEEFLAKKDTIVDKQSKIIGGIKGEVITTSGPYIYKNFVFKKDGINYVIEYKKIYKDSNEVHGELPLSEVEKMIKSLKSPEEIETDKFVDSDAVKYIYNLKDMKKARDMIGFDFKLPMDTYFGDYSNITYDEDMKYISYNCSGDFNIDQRPVAPYYYDQFVKYGKFEMADAEKPWFDKMEGKWENINGRKVLKEIDSYELEEGQTEPDKNIDYTWYDNDIYYSIGYYVPEGKEVSIDIENVMKHLMDSKSFDEIIQDEK